MNWRLNCSRPHFFFFRVGEVVGESYGIASDDFNFPCVVAVMYRFMAAVGRKVLLKRKIVCGSWVCG